MLPARHRGVRPCTRPGPADGAATAATIRIAQRVMMTPFLGIVYALLGLDDCAPDHPVNFIAQVDQLLAPIENLARADRRYATNTRSAQPSTFLDRTMTSASWSGPSRIRAFRRSLVGRQGDMPGRQRHLHLGAVMHDALGGPLPVGG